MDVRSSYFYKKKDPKVLIFIFFPIIINHTQACSTKGYKFRIGDDGTVEALQRNIGNENETKAVSSFCIDNCIEKSGKVSEVILTDAFDCLDKVEEGVDYKTLIFKIASLTSLVCLILTGLVYIVLPCPEKKAAKAKIILINVIFVALFCALFLLFQLTNPKTWQLTCSNLICRYVSCFILFYNTKSLGPLRGRTLALITTKSHVHIYNPCSLILMYVSMMHVSVTFW